MPAHRLPQDFDIADFPASGQMFKNPNGYMIGWAATAPDSDVLGYCAGAIFMHTDGAADSQLYVNEGNATSSVWTVVGSVG